MTWLLVPAAVLLAATVQQATGFGFALVLTPLLTLVIDPHAAVLVALALGTLGNLVLAVGERQHTRWSTVAGVVLAALPGMVLGAWLYLHISPQALQLAVATAVAAAVVVLALDRTPRAGTPAATGIAGLLTGVLTTTTGTNGPPVVALLAARRLTPAQFRSTAATVFLLLDLVALCGLLAARASVGHSAPDVTPAEAVAVVGALLAGTWLGHVARRRLDAERFRKVVLALLALTAVGAFAAALR